MFGKFIETGMFVAVLFKKPSASRKAQTFRNEVRRDLIDIAMSHRTDNNGHLKQYVAVSLTGRVTV